MTTLKRPLYARRAQGLWLFTVGALVICVGSSIAAAQGGRRRGAAFSDMTVQRDIVNRRINGHSLRLDIYLPKSITHPLPVATWIHGGVWSHGVKEQRSPVNLLAHGYAMAHIEYRLSQEAPFPAQIEDCKAAVDRSGPSEILGLYQALGREGGHRGDRGRHLTDQFIGGSPEANRAMAIAASPITSVLRDEPPFLIIHGEHDSSVPVEQNGLFVQKLKAAGVDATLIVANRGHSVRAARYGREIVSFFNRTLKNDSTE